MNFHLSKEINEIIAYSREEAMRTGSYEITSDHVVLGILRHKDNDGYDLLLDLMISIPYLKLKIGDKIGKKEMIPYAQADKLTFSNNLQNALKMIFVDAQQSKKDIPGAFELMLAIIRCNDSYFTQVLNEMGYSYEVIRKRIIGDKMEGDYFEIVDDRDEDFEDEIDSKEGKTGMERPQKPSMLDSFGYDLTKAAREEKLDSVVGREREIERLAQILGRRKKNNPIIIGEPGVGKSAIAEGLAIRIAKKDISRALMNKRIVSLDIGSIVAGTKFRGQFEERIKAILKELKETPDVILFIDEMHTLVGAGGAVGSLDAANMLKPALARGDIQCIGATTLDEFREIIEKDGALERRFQKVMVEPTNFEETLNILTNIKEHYEKHHNVVYSAEALRACISLSVRYISDRCLPDKAIDVMDEAGSRAHLRNMRVNKTILNIEKEIEIFRTKKREAVAEKNFKKAEDMRFLERESLRRLDSVVARWNKKMEAKPETITPENIAEVMSMMTGIPINRIALSESNRLLSMGSKLKERIIGQDEAVDKVVRAIRRNRAGLKDPNKPIGTFIFLGPTGVGKTQLAKVLAEYMFDSQDSIIRIDMSEYMEKYAVSRLIGAPPGYVGYEEGGQLSERVRRKPYSVVLLDEIEKAHPDIFNILLQVLDEGRLTDSNGRFIDFKNTILIMTSNIGSRELKDFGGGIGYATVTKNDSNKNSRAIVEKAVGKTFTPEFLNRLDEQIIFNSLTKADIGRIIDIELRDLYKRVEEIGYKLTIDKKGKQFIADMGYDPRFGARPLKRAIQKYVEDALAETIIGGAARGLTLKLKLNAAGDGLVVS